MNTENNTKQRLKQKSNWGAKLFYFTLLGTFCFFWWLLIYSHGVSPH